MSKEQVKIYLTNEVNDTIDKRLEVANCRSRSEFIEKAVKFYLEFLDSENATTFLPQLLADTLRSVLAVSTKGTERNLFKLSVEVATLCMLMQDAVSIEAGQLEKYRKTAYETVKKNNGIISVSALMKLSENIDVGEADE